MFLKNTASQKFIVYAYTPADGLPKTGDAAQLTAYVGKDWGTATVLTDTSATEIDATNAPGYYLFDAAQGETDAEVLHITAKSSTSGVKVLGAPAVIYPLTWSATRGLAGTALPAAAADAAGGLPISDAGGLDLDAKLAATNEVTAARMSELDAGTGGKMAAEVDLIKGYTDDIGTAGAGLTALGDVRIANLDAAVTTRAVAGDAMALTSGERTTLAAAIWNALTSGMSTVGSIGKKLADWTIHSAADVWASVTRTLTAATNITSTGGTTVPQTGDSFARIGAAGAGLTAVDDAMLTAIAALNNLSAAQINAEVVDALRTDTGTEVSAVPSATATIAAQIQYLFQALRNQVDITATAKKVHTDSGAVVGTKTLSDDLTTYSESKAV